MMKNKLRSNEAEPVDLGELKAKPPKAIGIIVSYEWPQSVGSVRSPRGDTHWPRIRKLLSDVVVETAKRLQSRKGSHKLRISVSRMRARHGMHILTTIRERIARADVVVVDFASIRSPSGNPNVMIELGMAIQAGKLDSGSLFVLRPDKAQKLSPSDLKGLLYSDYRDDKKGAKLRLVDPIGFRAALRARLIEVAEDRGMTGPRRTTIDWQDG